jgi:Ca-activated chloride channel family protein
MAQEPEQTGTEFVELDAPQAVRKGNSHLTNGQPDKALEAYRYAEELEPDAREIAFVEGLAHYDLKEFDAAREAFRKAALGNGSLADDALYSLGVSDHAEALTNIDGNPQAALGLLEGAMRRYHDVLARQPEHTATRDANFKAAHMWRQLKQQLEQQQQQQQQDQDQEPNDEDTEQQQDQQQQGQDEDDQEQQQSDASERPEDQQEQRQQQQSQADKQEQVSREQAERRLREMMQAVRDRKKRRREQVPNVPIAPVDKDW